VPVHRALSFADRPTSTRFLRNALPLIVIENRSASSRNSIWSLGNTTSPSRRFLIALHSRGKSRRVGPPIGAAEKSRDELAERAQQSVLHSPVCLGVIAKYGQFSQIPISVGGLSLQCRLRGGAGWIRTVSTVLSRRWAYSNKRRLVMNIQHRETALPHSSRLGQPR
jgi:hypothetical protein